jgi:hypothetical protein
MVKQRLVTLIVPSLVLDEFRRLGWIYPSRLRKTNRLVLYDLSVAESVSVGSPQSPDVTTVCGNFARESVSIV